MKSQTFRSASRLVCWLSACALAATASHADWLVTRSGERIETAGGWEIRGRMVLFTIPGGPLSSLRLSEIDLDASAAATAAAAAAAATVEAAEPAKPARPRPPVKVITTEDVGEGIPGAEGPDLLVERLRQAHALKDVGLAMGLVNWQDVPEGIRDYIETQLEWMMERRIQSIRFVPSDPEAQELLLELQDGVLYEPNLDVVGRIEIDFLPDPDQAELALTFTVGTRLGAFFLAAPREVAE